jgi:NitT/TauT family transport system substrate-binding protein
MPSSMCSYSLRLVAALALLLAAAPAAHAQPALTTLKVGFTPDDDVTPLVWGQKSGLFARAGIDVQYERASNGSAVTAAVASGAYDIGKSSLLSLMNAHVKGLPIALIAAGVLYDTKTPYTELLVPKDVAIASGKDLNGKVVASASLRDLAQLAISAWVDKHGGDSKTLQFVEVPMSATGPALAEHRIYAASVTEPFLDAELAGGAVRGMGSAYAAISPHFLIAGWFATTDWTSKHPDLVRRFSRAFAEAAAYTNTHRAETVPMMAELTGIPVTVYSKLGQRAYIATSLSAADIQPLIDAAAKYGIIPRGFPAQELIDASLR